MDSFRLEQTMSSAMTKASPYIEQASTELQKTRHQCHILLKQAQNGVFRLSEQPHVKEITYSLLFSTLAIYLLTTYLRRRTTNPPPSRPSTPTIEKAPSSTSNFKAPTRQPGTWTPSSFTLPRPDPYPSWSITDTKPLPYRPFRHGPKNFITMGLRSVPHDQWIELDNAFPGYHGDKARRIRERGEKCCRTAPEAYDAACELLMELARYLSARYPGMYTLTTGTPTASSPSAGENPEGQPQEPEGDQFLTNTWSNETFNITHPTEDPMQTCARLTQDDLAIMIEKPDGQYYLLAGAILLAGFWRLEDKFGMPLSLIHTSGDVPQFQEKLEKGMMNFFRRLKPEELMARNNYFLQVDEDLAWSYSIGSEDAGEGEPLGWATAEKDKAIQHHWFRSERQTLRRLPKSGGVVFTIRTYFHPVTEVAQEDYVPGRLASAVRSWGDDVGRYKGRERYGEVLLEYLDGKHREQLERGLQVEKEDEARSYPW